MPSDDWDRYLAHFGRTGKRPTILFSQPARAAVWAPAVDVYETPDAIVVQLDLAGVDAAQTEVHTDPHKNLLTIRGVRHAQAMDHRTYHALEIPYGRFERSLHLPAGLDTSAAAASYRDGMLEITLPKSVPTQLRVTVDQPDTV